MSLLTFIWLLRPLGYIVATFFTLLCIFLHHVLSSFTCFRRRRPPPAPASSPAPHSSPPLPPPPLSLSELSLAACFEASIACRCTYFFVVFAKLAMSECEAMPRPPAVMAPGRSSMWPGLVGLETLKKVPTFATLEVESRLVMELRSVAAAKSTQMPRARCATHVPCPLFLERFVRPAKHLCPRPGAPSGAPADTAPWTTRNQTLNIIHRLTK
eukprot:TRINITY_DN393_c1_g1_i1.p1 TRINITY_DN393_c1_g1~~TRINITY_DN393_c1_g1_i1.p1  ORF type:complete len:233 (-),score=6.82 TRINITY_DN393_c1_g1_i1:8-646(-)